MKKIVLIVIIIIVTFACACSIKISAKNFDLPHITWSMSMDDVFHAYGITKEDTSRFINQGRGSMFTLNDYELFGEIPFLMLVFTINIQLLQVKIFIRPNMKNPDI